MPYADHAILLVLMFFQPAFSEAAVQIRKRFAVVVVCGVLAGTGQADAANELSAREAAAIAMKNAGVAAEDIFNLKTEHDEENGIAVYTTGRGVLTIEGAAAGETNDDHEFTSLTLVL